MRWLPLVFFLLGIGPCVGAEPFARVAIEDRGAIVPGQQVRLDVTVFAPDFFTSPPQFPLFDLPNAVVTLPDERAQNSSETVDGVQYSAIRRIYAVVPETAGTFALPTVAIELGYSVDGKPVKGEATLPAFAFTVTAGRTSTGRTLAFAATRLTLSQSFDRDPTSLRVGDALVRTITLFAGGTQAMMIPAVDAGMAVGLKQYAPTPRLDDNVSAGRETGSRRIETMTYTADMMGTFVIPEISYAWYDTEARKLSSVTLPKVIVSVATAATSNQGIAPEVDAVSGAASSWRGTAGWSMSIALFLLAGFFSWRLRTWLERLFRRWLEAYRNTNRRALATLRATIRTASPPEIEAALRLWSLKQGYRSLTAWADQSAALQSRIESLQQLLYADIGEIALDREGLLAAVSSCRRQTALQHVSRRHLPALNPQR